MEEKLKYFGSKVDALVKGMDITRAEARDLFREILLNQQPDLQQGAFLAALTAKGATPEELAGSWEAIYDIDTNKVRPEVNGPLVDNCGTGMDTIKTFNISTSASIVAAAAGINMAKHGARAITSKCGTVDIVEALGVDVECDVSVVKRSIESAGIGMFNGMSGKVHPQALGRILSQIRFGTVLNMAGSLANPALPTYGVRGIYSKEMVLPVTKTMKEIGYQRAFVMHGMDADQKRGLDEISTLGPTFVAELMKDGSIVEYTMDFRDLGIKPAKEQVILCKLDREHEAREQLRILSGEDKGSRRDIVCLNTAPILYITGKATDLLEGYHKAQQMIDSGKALRKLVQWVAQQQTGDASVKLEKLEKMIEAAGASS
ncbi:MAG: Anthranilate phosphoribosyltransferase [Methanomassiliicoccales archaeon PtaU1.Bin124]|nr:MAG: Anthranilate phosphoribosyltransferase [Methanomassiliicoccales archaeon PtaU1.Bin124]